MTASQSKRRARQRAAIIVAAVVLASCVIGVAGYFLVAPQHPSQTSTAQPAASPPSAMIPPPPTSALEGLLLGADQINAAMNTSGMSLVGTMATMADNSFLVSDQTCLPLSAAAQVKDYEGSGYSAVRIRVVAKAQQSAVDQSVVQFLSQKDAASFFASSTKNWMACANRQFTMSAGQGTSQVQTVGPVSNANGLLSATVTPAESTGICERALTVAGSVVIDITACGGPAGAAVNVAHQVAAKVHPEH